MRLEYDAVLMGRFFILFHQIGDSQLFWKSLTITSNCLVNQNAWYKQPTRCNNNNFIDNFNQLNMFRGDNFAPSSGSLDCVYSLWYNAPAVLPGGDQDGDELSSTSS